MSSRQARWRGWAVVSQTPAWYTYVLDGRFESSSYHCKDTVLFVSGEETFEHFCQNWSYISGFTVMSTFMVQLKEVSDTSDP